MSDQPNQVIPTTTSVPVAQVAVAWEITKAIVRDVYNDTTGAEERAMKLADIFVKTLKRYRAVRERLSL